MVDRWDERQCLGYLEGDLTPDEMARFEQRMSLDRKLRELIKAMQADRAGLRALPDEQPPTSVMDAVNGRLERVMLLEDSPSELAEAATARRVHRGRLLAYAGLAAMVLLSTGLIIYTLTDGRLQEQLVMTSEQDSPADEGAAGPMLALKDSEPERALSKLSMPQSRDRASRFEDGVSDGIAIAKKKEADGDAIGESAPTVGARVDGRVDGHVDAIQPGGAPASSGGSKPRVVIRQGALALADTDDATYEAGLEQRGQAGADSKNRLAEKPASSVLESSVELELFSSDAQRSPAFKQNNERLGDGLDATLALGENVGHKSDARELKGTHPEVREGEDQEELLQEHLTAWRRNDALRRRLEAAAWGGDSVAAAGAGGYVSGRSLGGSDGGFASLDTAAGMTADGVPAVRVVAYCTNPQTNRQSLLAWMRIDDGNRIDNRLAAPAMANEPTAAGSGQPQIVRLDVVVPASQLPVLMDRLNSLSSGVLDWAYVPTSPHGPQWIAVMQALDVLSPGLPVYSPDVDLALTVIFHEAGEPVSVASF